MKRTTWEVNWAHPQNTGSDVMARNTASHQARTRRWHMTSTGYLREHARIKTPVYRRDSWQVNWKRRSGNGRLVWARNPASKMPSAHEWHWVDYHTLTKSGVNWQPVSERTGRHLTSKGYVKLTRRGMTEDDIAFAKAHDLFLGTRQIAVFEHQLVACRKYGGLPEGTVVRHRNGIKSDNRPDNLLLGTTQENTMDHDQARMAAMFWREQYFAAVLLIEQLLLAAQGWRRETQ